MKKYYVDTRKGEIITDITTLAPELYYSYEKGTMEGIIIEQYYCDGNKRIDFAHSYPSDKNVGDARQLHFESHNAKPLYLCGYVVPPSVYEEIINEYESSLIEEE